MINDPQLFPLATSYPSFFSTNLTDPNRIIKIVKGNNCSIRAYYFQLFKMMIQLEVQRDGQLLDYSKIFFNKIQQMLNLLPFSSNFLYIRHQTQTLLSFVKQLLQKDQTNFQMYLNKNKQIDSIIVSVFSQILRQGGLINQVVQDNIRYLAKFFDQRLTQLQNCIKFHQSDVFVYIQNQQLLFLAFLKLQDQPQNQPNQIDKQVVQKSLKHPPIYDKNKKNSGTTQNDTIINIFGDILQCSKYSSDQKINNNFSRSLSPKTKQQQHNIIHKFSQNFNKIQIGQQHYGNFIKKDKQISHQNKFVKNQSEVEKYQRKLQNKNVSQKMIPKQEVLTDELIYRPSSPNNFPKNLIPVSQTTKQLPQSLTKKNDYFNWLDQQKNGQRYRQFTNTRILNMLPHHQRETVKSLKNKFVRIHAHNFPNQP